MVCVLMSSQLIYVTKNLEPNFKINSTQHKFVCILKLVGWFQNTGRKVAHHYDAVYSMIQDVAFIMFNLSFS